MHILEVTFFAGDLSIFGSYVDDCPVFSFWLFLTYELHWLSLFTACFLKSKRILIWHLSRLHFDVGIIFDHIWVIFPWFINFLSMKNALMFFWVHLKNFFLTQCGSFVFVKCNVVFERRTVCWWSCVVYCTVLLSTTYFLLVLVHFVFSSEPLDMDVLFALCKSNQSLSFFCFLLRYHWLWKIARGTFDSWCKIVR